MGTYKAAQTNVAKERNGATLITDFGTFKVRYMGRTNPVYLKAVTKKFKPYQRMIASADGLPEDLKIKLDMELLAEVGVVGWEKDVTGPPDPKTGEEKPLKWSKEAALKLFEDLPHVFIVVDWGAKQMDTFMDFDPEAASGN